jgi:hypothetical protein
MSGRNTASDRPRVGLAAFARGHLSTSDRLGETLCGLVTVLTFTLVAGERVDDGRPGVLQLLAATVGCCITWGLIDGVLYALDGVSRRARRSRLATAIRDVGDDPAMRALRRELDDLFEDLGVRDEDGAIFAVVRERVARGPLSGIRVRREDWLGGLAIFFTQLLCSIPAVLPFVVLDQPSVALRVSNATLLLMLFGVGFQWAGEVGAHRVRSAFVAALLGAALVGFSIALQLVTG